MKKWQIEGIRWTQFSMEMMLLYILLFPIYVTEERFPPSYPFITIVLLGAIIFSVIFKRVQKKWISAIVIPILVLIGTFLEFPILLASFLSIIIFWRVAVNLEQGDRTSEISIFFFTLGLGLVYYFWLHSFDGRYLLIVFIFLQFLLTLSLKTISVALQSSLNDEQKYSQLKWMLGGIVTVSFASVLIGFAYPFLKSTFLLGLQGIAYVLNFIAAPILIFFDNLDLSLSSEEGMVLEVDSTFYDQDLVEGYSFTDSTVAGYIFAVILLVVMAYMIYRRTHKYKKTEHTQTIIEDYSLETVRKSTPFTNLRKRFASKNEVRHLFYDMEIKLAKMGMGRGYNETVDDWLLRLPVEDSLKDTIQSTYEKIRYGNGRLENNELAVYKKAIKQVKKQLRELKASGS
ncbi:hypothetical protein [Evansella tamaricis]|uniref:DUF4129 domain-containing protein n=1 Tax=Evansella tamaricis TaxID=2069301 RepID=A0ABS6JIX2_9BACI|nr:hypothetical protein [Evansella tamaricis]MBU9713593.1 hypothetical protein [Evansella tamaricis]